MAILPRAVGRAALGGMLTAASLALLSGPAARAQSDCDTPDSTTPCQLVDGMQLQGTLASSGDRRSYWFNVPMPRMHLHVVLTDLPADYDLYVFSDQSPDPTLPFAQSVTPGFAPEQIDMDVPDVGTYMVEVVSDPAQPVDADQPYTLLFNLVAATPEPSTPNVVAREQPPAAPASPVAAPARVIVPPVMYQPASAVMAGLWAGGLFARVQTVDRFSPAGAGTVVGQQPQAGESLEVGATVTLQVASGLVEVPNVVNLMEQAASDALHQAGFQVRIVRTPSTTVPLGYAAAVQPLPSTVLPSRAQVTLVISRGA